MGDDVFKLKQLFLKKTKNTPLEVPFPNTYNTRPGETYRLTKCLLSLAVCHEKCLQLLSSASPHNNDLK